MASENENRPRDGSTEEPEKKTTPAQVIRVVTTPAPELSPEEFNAALAKLQDAVQTMQDTFSKAYITADSLRNNNQFRDQIMIMRAALNGLKKAIERGTEIATSDAWKNIKEALNYLVDNTPAWIEAAKSVADLSPYILAELDKPEYSGLTFDALYEEGIDENGDIIPGSIFEKLIQAAKEAQAAALPKTAIKRAQIIEYPLDKPNAIIWRLLEADTQGQISLEMASDKDKRKGIKLPAYYAINFDDLGNDIQITKRLLPFDKRVYVAVSALFNAGNNVITLSQIYYAMGYTGRPGTKDLTRINDAVTKMTTARIYFNNEQEAAKYKYNLFKYDGSLLPLERGTAIINGQLADAAIHIFREPPLITFAKQRRQITTFDVKLLQSPVNKTDANLQIEDYLIERICKAKNGKKHSCRILFKTLYENTGIPDRPKTNTEKQQKKRAPAKVEKYLTHYQKQGFIIRFTTEKDGITVYW